MRGKLKLGEFDYKVERIIPAHAGQTNGVNTARWFAADHPRTCGANTVRQADKALANGSSPHMRGKR